MLDNGIANVIGIRMTWPATIDHSGHIMADFKRGTGSLSCEKDQGYIQCTAIDFSRGGYNG